MTEIQILRPGVYADPAQHYDVVRESLLERVFSRFENDHEMTTSLEYRLHGALVHRSSHVTLKEWPDGFNGLLGQPGAGSIRPTDSLPDSPSAKQIRALAHLRMGGARFANVQAMCSQFKVDILNGLHAFGTTVVRGATTKDAYKAALYLASGSRGAADTVYSTTGELAGTGNYTQGGIAVTTGTAPSLSGTTAIFTPNASLSWAALTSSGSFDCMVLYNDTSSTKLEVAVFTFGAQSITAGTFTLTMPTNDASNALIRIA